MWGPTFGLSLADEKLKKTLLTAVTKASTGVATKGSCRFASTPDLKNFKEMDSLPLLGSGFTREVSCLPEVKRMEAKLRSKEKEFGYIIKGAGYSRKWRTILFNACYGSSFKYGLATLNTTVPEERKIDAVQDRFLRRMLKVSQPWLRREGEETLHEVKERFNIRPWSWEVRKRRWGMFKKTFLKHCQNQ